MTEQNLLRPLSKMRRIWFSVSNLDQALLSATRRCRSGELKTAEIVLRGVSRAGDGYFWLFMLAVAFATRHYKAAIAGPIAATFGLVLSLSLKHLCRRARPRSDGDWSRFVAPDKYSFPSGHTTTAFCLATVTAVYWPAVAPLLWVCAACIGVSRTLLAFHYVSDVIAGVGLGLLSGIAAVRVVS